MTGRRELPRQFESCVGWTAADSAELELLIHKLQRAVAVHREQCSTCRGEPPWCPKLRDGLDAVLEWRESAMHRSKAEWLRRHEGAA